MTELNFLYCFDKNYNIQGYLSIASLLENVTEKINIFIIHDNVNSFLTYKDKLSELENINQIQIFDFNLLKSKFSFPNIQNTHVSRATYFRIFAENFLADEIKNYIYMDADIFCLQNPVDLLKIYISELNKVGYIIGAVEEFPNSSPNESHFSRLDLKNNSYFNAGLMIVNNELWKQNNTSKNLISNSQIFESKLLFWDQDLLNIEFDGKYLKLNNFINFNLFLTEKNYFLKEFLSSDVIFIHYAGSYKPWTVRGAGHAKSTYYQDIYNRYFNKKFHIVSRWRLSNLYELVKVVLSIKFYKIRFPFSYIYYSLKAIIQKS